LDEEYLTRKRNGKYKSVLQDREFITFVLPVVENFSQKRLLIITEKGKIKL
jgi:hypothetical protein